MFTRLLQTVLSFKINLSTNFQIGGQLEDKLSNWRTNCQIGGQIVKLEDVLLSGGQLYSMEPNLRPSPIQHKLLKLGIKTTHITESSIYLV